MKKLLSILVIGWAMFAQAQVPPPPAATVAEVQAGTIKNKYVSPYTLANGGLSGALTDTTDYMTTNNVPPFGVHDWSDQGLNTTAFYNNGEWVMNSAGINNQGSATFLTVPAGTTNIQASWSARITTGTGGCLFRLMAAGGASEISRTNVTLTTTYSNFVINATAANIATYNSNILFNFYYQSTTPFVVSNFAIAFQGATDPIFQGTVKRFTVNPANVWNDYGAPVATDKGKVFSIAWPAIASDRATPYSYVEFKTDASVVDLDISCFGNMALSQVVTNTVYVDGIFSTNLGIGNLNANPPYWMTPVYVGAAGTMHTVRFYTSFMQYGYGNQANTLRAVNIPLANHLEFTKKTQSGTLLLIGDSILVGNPNVLNSSQSPPELLRRYLPYNVVNYAQGGGSLSNAMLTTPNFTERVIAEAKPSVVWIEHGVNDFGQSVPTNCFATNYVNLLDIIHKQAPYAMVYCQNILTNLNSPVNGASLNISSYRLCISNAAASRSTFAKYIEAVPWLQTADLSGDNVHPTAQGYAKYSWNIVQQIWTNTFAPY